MEIALESIKIKKITCLPFIIFGLASAFYLYEFILQVSPGIMTDNLMGDLHIDATGLGIISACYYYAYTPMQLPAGLLFDRFGPRVLMTLALIICAMGAILFGAAHSLLFISLGRFLMGVGSAFSFIGALVLIARWFPPQYFAMLAGITQLIGSAGAVAGEAPLSFILTKLGWRNTMIDLAVIGFILAILMWFFIRDKPEEIKSSTKKIKVPVDGELTRLKAVLHNSQTWFIAIYAFAIWAPITVFAVLWGIPFIKQLYGINVGVASAAVSMIWIGIGVGSPAFGWWSDRIGRRNLPLTVSAAIGLIATIFIIYVPLSLFVMFILLFLMGLAASGQSVSFAVVKDINKASHMGSACGFNNMAVVAGGALFQPLAGFLLSYFWSGSMFANIPVYSITNYQKALFVVPVCFLLSLIISMKFIKETHGHPVWQ